MNSEPFFVVSGECITAQLERLSAAFPQPDQTGITRDAWEELRWYGRRFGVLHPSETETIGYQLVEAEAEAGTHDDATALLPLHDRLASPAASPPPPPPPSPPPTPSPRRASLPTASLGRRPPPTPTPFRVQERIVAFLGVPADRPLLPSLVRSLQRLSQRHRLPPTLLHKVATDEKGTALLLVCAAREARAFVRLLADLPRLLDPPDPPDPPLNRHDSGGGGGFSCGVALGPVAEGTVGDAFRYEPSLVSSTVNMASRLQAYAKRDLLAATAAAACPVLCVACDEPTHARFAEVDGGVAMPFRRRDPVPLKGFESLVRVWTWHASPLPPGAVVGPTYRTQQATPPPPSEPVRGVLRRAAGFLWRTAEALLYSE